jgi:predicted ester cyclase
MKKLALFLSLVVLFSFALGSQQAVEKKMCEKKAQLMLDKVLEMWNKPNLALIPELYTSDCVVTHSSTSAPYLGHEGIKKWIEDSHTMLPDMVMTIPDAVVQGDKIVKVWTITGTQSGPMVMPGGTMPATGRKVSITGLAIYYLKGGKFAKEVVVFNVLEMMMQMGFTLTPPQPPPPPAPVK